MKMKMKLLFVLQCLLVLVSSKDFDFFYFVQQWPVSYCESRHGCCYPTTGRPEQDFGIHGLWPNFNNGNWPQNCDQENLLDQSKISDLMRKMENEWPSLGCPSSNGMKFWGHEWGKHGTCTTLDQYSYFQSALNLKKKANLLHLLSNAGIRPGHFYGIKKIKQAIKDKLEYEPYIECNVDQNNNHQLFQVYLCVDTNATNFIKCPILPHGRPCGPTIEFPSFFSHDLHESKYEL